MKVTDIIKKYKELEYDILQSIEDYLIDLEYPYNKVCISHICENYLEEHMDSVMELLEEDEIFYIDGEDTTSYWMQYVADLMKREEPLSQKRG